MIIFTAKTLSTQSLCFILLSAERAESKKSVILTGICWILNKKLSYMVASSIQAESVFFAVLSTAKEKIFSLGDLCALSAAGGVF